MTGQTTADWIAHFLRAKFPHGPTAHTHYGELIVDFWESGLASPHLLTEITSGGDGKFWSFLWEAMLYRHLRSLGFAFKEGRVTKAGQAGPDFGVVHNGQTIWIEAVVPAPSGIPEDFLRSPELGEPARVRSAPHEAVQLRWLSAIADKQKKIAEYISTGLIAPTECAVIAINGCRLADWWPNDNGVSQLPMVVEAVFGIGPIAIPISPGGKLDGEPIRLPRRTIQKPNKSHVPTTSFLYPEFAHIGAALGCIRKDMLQPTFPLTVVHNPLATNPVPRRILAATKEFVADEQGDTYLLHPLDD